MPKKKSNKQLTDRYKKQHGLHHKHSNKYIKVYWPYIPVLLFIITGVSLSLFILSNKNSSNGVAANISAQAIINQTNQARISNKLPALSVNNELSKAAQIKANDMAVNNYWAPVSPSGQTPWQIVKSTGYNYQIAGENLAYGFNSSKSVLSAWMGSQSHKENILNSNYSDIGLGIAYAPNFENQGPQTIVVAIYGSQNPITSPAITFNKAYTNSSLNQPASLSILSNRFLTDNSGIVLYISGLLIFAVGGFLILKHGMQIRKWALQGEKLALKHPFMDIVLVIVILGIASLNQTVGLIR